MHLKEREGTPSPMARKIYQVVASECITEVTVWTFFQTHESLTWVEILAAEHIEADMKIQCKTFGLQ
jgi:hypothetical protein